VKFILTVLSNSKNRKCW